MGTAPLSLAAALVAMALTVAPAAADEARLFEAMAVLRPTPPTPAPDVAFRTLDGNPVRLSAFRGRPVLLTFFTTW
jgi:cytochrome oxidase Cu insertion factor (SCO1/SenC/PrrC family)